MADPSAARGWAPVGRAGELQALRAVIDQASAGQAGTVLVSGEAGVGKTVLVHEACDRARPAADVVWASCLPLTSLAVPLPRSPPLRRWASDAGVPLPDLSRPGVGGLADAPTAFDEWLDGLSAERPVVLVLDDLHWADQSTLDVLMYVLVGPQRRRLAVIGTIRSEDAPEGHRLRRWLADVRRLPGVGELTLAPLDRVSTREQIATLFGEPPHEALVDDVYGRSRGNAYLTSLLVRGLAPNATALPADLPSELSDALAHSWHGMSTGARELTRTLAVSGRPETGESMSRVLQQAGIDGDVTALLHEATQAGVLLARPAATYWFAHPLVAEVLEAGLPPGRRRVLHACWAQLLTGVHDTSSDELDPAYVIGIADHHFRSDDTAAAYEWALRGADAAERSGGHSEAMRLLRRALELLRDQGDTEAERALLDRIRRAGQRTGDQRGELTAVDELLARIDPDQEPMVVSELLVRRSQLRQLTGQHFADDTDAREAVRLSARHPNSAAHAIALTELERCYFWQGDERGEDIARQALESALASGDRRALSFALTSNVRQQSNVTHVHERVLADAHEAQAAALDADDDEAYLMATVWLGNLTGVPWADNVIEIHRAGLQTLVQRGAPHAYVSLASVRLADGLFARGDWSEAEELLRVALGSAPAPMADASARLLAATLACRQGRQHEAEAHLLRAEEIFAERSGFLGMSFVAVETEVALAHGDYGAAIAGAMGALERDGTVPDRVESLVPRVARALANQAQAARDRDLDPAEHTSALRKLRERFPSTVEDFIPGPTYAMAVDAFNAIYDAELLRALGDSGAAATWRRAAELCAAALMPWDEAYSAWRAAEAGLRTQEGREQAIEALRRAHRLALSLQMLPLLEDIASLARSGRIRLSEPVVGERSAAQPIPGLSRREREILAEVVAGKTYGDIARMLFISEKTVSVHVSNMLRKTGTSNRVELAQLATRLGGQG